MIFLGDFDLDDKYYPYQVDRIKEGSLIATTSELHLGFFDIFQIDFWRHSAIS